MRYVDGYVLPVAKKNLPAYRRLAKASGKVWRKHGALEYVEAVGDDLNPKHATLKFPRMARCKRGETVVFAFIVYKSRAHRDRVNARVMEDPLMSDPKWKDRPIPFDMKRLGFAGFKVLVDA